ncbi:hypothetical protein ASPSYDRAFT_37986 [Aspergillus sydowii CBS 593.65]|uniref:Chitin-binding type-1 domain-containing protein n=1 Tax=Aspergillus sydowii CBS 593.65 TaxID=1036612 RepID=A0A1L9TVH7_9EURO|nr:uncharacterized protein ASPSYDRAFT_37986 [Aspergillus sydowii CBS 593.65]OJJ63434.1 hypothetical protein ASPSYDRAFT_37986 [Aspergillus sydowii CBS 593.65]
MCCCSKIVLGALALVSVTKWANAAPVLGMRIGGTKDNEVMPMLSGETRCSGDAQCGPGGFCSTTDGVCIIGCGDDASCSESQVCEARAMSPDL